MADERDFASVEDVMDVEDVEGVEGEAEKAPEGEAARKSRHDQRVARLAERFASFVAKGEEVVASLESKADAADASFGERREATEARIDDLAQRLEARVTTMGERLVADLEVIASGVDGRPEAEPASASDEPYQARFTPAARQMRERMRVGSGSELLLTDPEFVERFANFAFDDVPAAVDLPDRTRFMCWLATLLGCQGIDEYRALLPAALNVGLEPIAAREIVYQAAAYLGIGRVYPFLKATNEALVAAGVELPLATQATTEPTEESRYEGGERAQMACFGEQMRGYKDRGAQDYPWINQWLVKNCFGDWYTRGGLTIPEREMVTFCFIAAQGGCEAQLRGHTAANVQCGNDRSFLIKVVSNNVPFIGYPRSLNAMAVVEEVTAE